MAGQIPLSKSSRQEAVGPDADTPHPRSDAQGIAETDHPAQAAAHAAEPAAPPAGTMTPAMTRMRAESAVGQVVMALSALPRYRHLPLSEIDSLVLQPLMRNRLVIAAAAAPGATGAEEAETGADQRLTAGFAIWASVSEDVDGRIREQIAAGVFPIRLRPEDWTSGTINWLLDVIALDARMVTAILANFRKLAVGGDLRLHPLISRLVPRETLEKMGATPMQAQGAHSAGAQPARSGADGA